MGILDDTFAVALVMFGVIVLQTHFYYLYFGHDILKLRLLVAFVFLMDATHSAFVCHVNYYYLISSFGHPERLQNGIWTLFSAAGLTVLLSVTVKSFYILQIYRLCRPRWRWWVCFPLIVSVIGHLASGIEIIVDAFIEANFSSATGSQTSIIALSIISLVSDIMVSITLCVLLQNRRSVVKHLGIKRTLNSIILFCVQRFIFSMLISIVLLLMVSIRRVPWSESHLTYIDVALNIVHGKVVTSSFLPTLNSRMALKGSSVRGDLSTTDDTTTNIPMSRRPVTTTTTSLYTTGVTVEDSIDDAEGYGLRTRDLEASIRSNKSSEIVLLP